MASQIDEDLVSFIVDTNYKDIPDETVEYTKRLALKAMAGTVVGSTEPSGQKVSRYVAEHGGNQEEAGVIACGFETDLRSATLANGTFVHAPELEDDKLEDNEDVAWSVTTLPVTFSLAQHYRLSGKEFIEASAIGMEIHTRLSTPPNEGLETDVIIQTASIAGAAAAAKAMRLNYEQTEHALGLAATGGGVFIPNTGKDAHFLDSAFQCVRGMESARMAEEGVTGNPNTERLFESLYGSRMDDIESISRDLGDDWKLHRIGIKKYPCCFLTHRYIDALRELIEEHDISYENVEQVEIDIGESDTIAEDPDPQDTDEAQFSFQHLLGAVLRDHDITFDQIANDAVYDAKYQEARDKVHVTVRSEWSQPAPEATVTVVMKDGDRLQKTRETYHGSPKDPLTEDEFRHLYEKFTHGILPEDTIDRTADDILNIENRREMQQLLEELTYR